MARTEAFTVRTEPEIVHQLDDMAESLDRSRNYIVNQALKEYLHHHAWQNEKINQDTAAADRGELVEHEDVMHEMETIAQPSPEDEFFNCAGIWEDREIDQAAIHVKAWPERE